MNRAVRLTHQFVEYAPEQLEEGILYVSIPYASAIHLCCCGCGREVVTPLTPRDWRLTFNGESVSLDPSIGNWSFACRSHYWIRNDSVRWILDRQRDRVGKDLTQPGRRPGPIPSTHRPSWSRKALERIRKIIDFG